MTAIAEETVTAKEERPVATVSGIAANLYRILARKPTLQ